MVINSERQEKIIKVGLGTTADPSIITLGKIPLLNNLTTIWNPSKAAAKEWTLLTLESATEDLNLIKHVIYTANNHIASMGFTIRAVNHILCLSILDLSEEKLAMLSRRATPGDLPTSQPWWG